MSVPLPHQRSPLNIHYSSYTKGMLGWPRTEITFIGEKVLVRMIEAVLGSYQAIKPLNDNDAFKPIDWIGIAAVY